MMSAERNYNNGEIELARREGRERRKERREGGAEEVWESEERRESEERFRLEAWQPRGRYEF